MNTLFHKIASFLIAPIIALMGSAGYTVPHTPIATAPSVGASIAIETPVALFSTSLTNGISSSATSMALVSATTLDGTTLASSTYSFIIDEGNANQEFVKADCTGSSCANMQRGLSAITGTTTVVGLAQQHRRGASVKITDAPLLLNLTRIINGIGTVPNVLSYTTHPTFTSDTQLVDYKYVNDTAVSGAPNSTESVKGIVELATAIEQASSTALGSTAASVVTQAKYATSSPTRGCDGTATAGALCSVIARNDGKINPNFIATSSTDTYNFGGNVSLSSATIASSTLASSTAYILNAGTINATSTVRANAFVGGGSGLTNVTAGKYTYASTSSAGAIAAGAVYTSSTVGIPASTLTASSSINIKGSYTCVSGGSSANTCILDVVDNSGNVYATYTANSNTTSHTDAFMFDATVLANNSTSAQRSVIQGTGIGTSGNLVFSAGNTTSNDWTVTRTFGVKLTTAAGTSNTSTLNSFSIVVNP